MRNGYVARTEQDYQHWPSKAGYTGSPEIESESSVAFTHCPSNRPQSKTVVLTKCKPHDIYLKSLPLLLKRSQGYRNVQLERGQSMLKWLVPNAGRVPIAAAEHIIP